MAIKLNICFRSKSCPWERVIPYSTPTSIFITCFHKKLLPFIFFRHHVLVNPVSPRIAEVTKAQNPTNISKMLSTWYYVMTQITKTRKFARLFQIHKMPPLALFGPFTDPNDRFPYRFINFN